MHPSSCLYVFAVASTSDARHVAEQLLPLSLLSPASWLLIICHHCCLDGPSRHLFCLLLLKTNLKG
jgi:hypothetical protein